MYSSILLVGLLTKTWFYIVTKLIQNCSIIIIISYYLVDKYYILETNG